LKIKGLDKERAQRFCQLSKKIEKSWRERSCGAKVKQEEENLFMEFQKEKKRCVKKIFVFLAYKRLQVPPYSLGATPIRSAGRASDKIETRRRRRKRREDNIFEPILKKNRL
jgi:hypothetical protein